MADAVQRLPVWPMEDDAGRPQHHRPAEGITMVVDVTELGCNAQDVAALEALAREFAQRRADILTVCGRLGYKDVWLVDPPKNFAACVWGPHASDR